MPKIVIAEDDEVMRTMIRMKCKREKFEVEAFPSGQEAKDYLEKEPADLVVTDLMMPFFSGLELVGFIRNELKSNVPIIVLSSAGQEDNVTQAFEMGVTDFMTKPFSPKELIMRIKRHV